VTEKPALALKYPLLLASTSRYRQELLARLHWPFDCQAPRVDETAVLGELPADRARRLALAKAQAVAVRHPDALVIGSDQVCALGERILDKPGNTAAQCDMLAQLSGRTALFHTAVAVVSVAHGVQLQHLDETRCDFRPLDRAEIERYAALEMAVDCAGGFKVEGLGIGLLERIESVDPTALIGLPLIWVAAALRPFSHEPAPEPAHEPAPGRR
jgi:septum formation protein